MIPKLTPEMRSALSAHPGQPIPVEDDETHRVYLLVDAQRGHELMERWLRDELQRGIDDLKQGRVVPFDAESIKAAGRRLPGEPS